MRRALPWGLLTGLGIAVLATAGCPPSSDCDVTLDCGPYQGLGAGASGGTASGGMAANGTPCSDAGDCASQFCVDDVCCDAACDGTCQGCNVSGSEGSCSAELAGTDPGGDCPGGSCTADGSCAVGNCIWSSGFGSPTDDLAYSVAADDDGYVFLGGYFGYDEDDTIDFGGEPLASAGGNDVYIAKFDPEGEHEWSYHFGDAGTNVLQQLVTDSTGAVIATGLFAGTMDFGGDPLPSASIITSDVFVVKLESDGTHAWSYNFGDEDSDNGTAVCVDGNDNVIFAGRFTGTIDFGDGDWTASNDDVFVAKFTSGGDIDWSRAFDGDDLIQAPNGITTDASDAVIFTGQFQGRVDFGGKTLDSTDSSEDAFIVKLDAEGDHVWSYRYGDGEYQALFGVEATDEGSIVAVGTMAGNLDFDGKNALESMGDTDAFVVKLDSGGMVEWAQRFGDEEAQFGDDVAIDADGNILLTGRFQGIIDFGGGPLLSAGSEDVFVAKLTADGTHLFSHRFGDNNNNQIASAIAVDPSGAALVAGRFEGTLDFGKRPLMVAGDDYDVFVAKLSP
jgi:hypothetical protein